MASYADPNLRIVLLGKTGSGKSSAGNTILGRNALKVSSSPMSVTRRCETQEAKVENKVITVVDTPGLFDTSMNQEMLKSEVVRCIYMSAPGPHVFLLAIRLDVRFTDEEKNTVKWIQENFGENAMQYTMVLFTKQDQLDQPIEQYIEECEDLKQLVNDCKAGYHSLNNKSTNNQAQVTQLLEKIDRLIQENSGEHYTNEMYQKAQEEFKENENKVKQQNEIYMKQMEENMKQMQAQFEENMKQKEENMKQMQAQFEENMKQKEENMKQMQAQFEENMKQKESNMKQKQAQFEENMKLMQAQFEENMKQKESNMKPMQEQTDNRLTTFSFGNLLDMVKLHDFEFPEIDKFKTPFFITATIVGGVFVLWIVYKGNVRKVITDCLSIYSLAVSLRHLIRRVHGLNN